MVQLYVNKRRQNYLSSFRPFFFLSLKRHCFMPFVEHNQAYGLLRIMFFLFSGILIFG
jgi:hypothetical protein